LRNEKSVRVRSERLESRSFADGDPKYQDEEVEFRLERQRPDNAVNLVMA